MDIIEKAKKVCGSLAAAGWAVILIAAKYAGKDSTQFHSLIHLPGDGPHDDTFLRADQVISRMKRQAAPFSPSESTIIGGTLSYPGELFQLLQDFHQDGWNIVAWCRNPIKDFEDGHVSLRDWPDDKVTTSHAFCDLKRELWSEWSAIAHKA